MTHKLILGLDLGTTSIGWALVKEAINPKDVSQIIKIGVRVNPLTADEKSNFSKGATITTNADRTLKRSMRRSLQRYKLRRSELIAVLKDQGWIDDDTILAENGNHSTFQTWKLRAKAATEAISLEEFARVLLMINKKRGYKSSRKTYSSEDGELIDGMEVAKQLYENDLTPGQFSYHLLLQGKKKLPDYYRSDLQTEFRKIWECQHLYYPELLTDDLYQRLLGRNDKQTWSVLQQPWNLVGSVKFDKKGVELEKEYCRLRTLALTEKLDLEHLVIVLQQINKQINNSSSYLGKISDRSKELIMNHLTVGQYQWAELQANPHHSLKNEVFYRADYLDEFETLWETQAQFHPELTNDLKKMLRDVIIFYQRPLRSQKGLLSFCELERKEIEIVVDGKKKTKLTGSRVAPKSSPLFQEFKIWQILNNVVVSDKVGTGKMKCELSNEQKQLLFAELTYCDSMSKDNVLALLYGKDGKNRYDLNYKEIEGNRTIAALYKAYRNIVNMEEADGKLCKDIDKAVIRDWFARHGINTEILEFNSNVTAEELEQQALYRLWHLLYSYEGDKSNSGIDKLLDLLHNRYGFTREQAKIIAKVKLQDDYGSLSTKAMRNILPYMREGKKYDEACLYAGYRHSAASLTREELDARVLRDTLAVLPKNSLRNPVVEKILNQMINVVNAIIAAYGRPDEIRIEMARELKKTAEQRADMTKSINEETKNQLRYRQVLHDEFGLAHVSRNDIVRYKLYLELAPRGYKTLYSDTYIPKEKLFSKEFDIEHIIPQARLFDDSFANKTLETRTVNLEKSNQTAYDYILGKYGIQKADEYKQKINGLLKEKQISATKARHLLMTDSEIPSDFLNRDLTDSAYIAKKAKEILSQVVKEVHTTTGSVTSRLREDWQLVDVLRELNWDKYNAIGQTEYFEDRDGRRIGRIKDWTKRNDHRHHAMDALTIAFTRPEFVNYLSNLNARSDKSGNIYAIEKQYLQRSDQGKMLFLPPMPLAQFRAEVLSHLSNVLVSIKAKNKVTTKNINKIKTKRTTRRTEQLTPRGQLHNETVYGRQQYYVTKTEKAGSSFDVAKIATIANQTERQKLLERLLQADGNPKKAFTGKNALDKSFKTVCLQERYTIRKPIDKNLDIDKVVDAGVRAILKQRLAEFGGNADKAFSNLDENPLFLNKAKGITIKRVTITGVNNAIALHDKKDYNGQFVLDDKGERIPTDFVSTSNNHHIAIYQDEKGNLQEKVVSFYEATARRNQGIPVVDKEYNHAEGWTFMFTMKQNEYFVFPDEKTGFLPQETDLLNSANYTDISPNLYRVQKLTTKYYVFRHHLETSVADDRPEHRNMTWKRIQNVNGLKGIVKVRVNHLGEIVQVGEY